MPRLDRFEHLAGGGLNDTDEIQKSARQALEAKRRQIESAKESERQDGNGAGSNVGNSELRDAIEATGAGVPSPAHERRRVNFSVIGEDAPSDQAGFFVETTGPHADKAVVQEVYPGALTDQAHELHTFKDRAGALSAEIEELKGTVEAQERTIADKADALERAGVDASRMRSEHDRRVQEFNDLIETAERKAREQIEELNTQINRLADDVSERDALIEVKDNSVEQLQQELATIRRESAQLAEELESVRAERTVATEGRANALERARALDARVREMEPRLLAANARLSDLAKENDRLKRVEAERDDLAQKLSDLQSVESALRTKVGDAQRAQRSAEQERDATERANDKLREERDNLAEYRRRVEPALGVANDIIDLFSRGVPVSREAVVSAMEGIDLALLVADGKGEVDELSDILETVKGAMLHNPGDVESTGS